MGDHLRGIPWGNIGEWLASLGLEQYARRFMENGIDLSVIRDLTEQDLRELGVLLGHRRKMLRGIAELSGSASSSRSSAESGRRSDAERRRLTVVVCDLVGSVALSAQHDPEDMREVIRAYHGCIAEIIARYGGTVARYMGDGALAYFGYPRANEDDSEQAVRAGLALVDAVSALQTEVGATLQVRVGVATGTVVVGDLGHDDRSHRRSIVGETPNLAASLQVVAEPGGVVISESTRRLTSGLFEYRDLGPVALKGWTEPVQAWQVLGPSAIESRFEALHKSTLRPPLGREEEMELLLRRWRRAAEGEGRVVMLTGEPGIGKSHIAMTLGELIAAEPHYTLRYFCSPHHSNSVLFPVIGQLGRAARLERSDSAAEKRAKLKAVLEEAGVVENEAFASLADLLLLPLDDHHRLPELSPQKRKEKTLAALLGQFQGLAARKPVLLIYEDLHWIDPTSLELLAMAVERIPHLPVLLLTTARPEFTPPWPGHAHVTTIPLTRLSRRDGAALVERITGGRALPDEVMSQILARTDGVPLFVEELTKTVLESGLLRERDGQYVLDRSLPPLAIPATLDASLMARLDRLAPVREVAQIGAVIGREFSYDMLGAVAGLPRDGLDEALRQLVRAELVFCRGEIPEAAYTFKHVLVRDAAYAQLLKGRRAQIHAAIAGAMEQRFQETAEAQPELLAHHLTEAGLADRSVRYWLRAGENAAARSANLEAIAHLERGIEAVARCAPGSERDRMELDLRLVLGPCLIAAQGHGSSKSVATFLRSRELCERLGDLPEYLQVMFWLVSASIVRAELPQAHQAAVTLIGLAETRGDRPALLNAMRAQAMILLFMGRLVESREIVEYAVETFAASDEATRLAARTAGQDAGAAMLGLASWVLWELGQIDEAAARMAQGLERAEAIQHPHTRAYVAYCASILYVLRGGPETALGHAERCLALSEEHGFKQWGGLARAVRGICLATFDPASGMLEEAMDALEEYRGSGVQLGITVLYVLLCPALLHRGRAGAALELIERALAAVSLNTERLFEAELYRLKARALLLRGAPDALAEARTLLDRALTTARWQNARSLELRAASDLANLLANDGKREEARRVLQPVYAWFTDGFETRDLKEAGELLQRL